jgi:hypothetical protein
MIRGILISGAILAAAFASDAVTRAGAKESGASLLTGAHAGVAASPQSHAPIGAFAVSAKKKKKGFKSGCFKGVDGKIYCPPTLNRKGKSIKG